MREIGQLRSLLLIAAAIVTVSCGPETKAEVRQMQVGWRPIVQFSGNGSSQTESFNIDGGQWRIKWTATNEAGKRDGTLKVTAHSAVSGRPIALAIDQKGAGHGIAYINEDPRLYHLVVESTGLDWSLAIEEAVVGY